MDCPELMKGWVPTVSGRLSFSVFGETDYPTLAYTANVADGKDRYLICWQRRTLLDSSLPAKADLSPIFIGLKGKFHFVCIGHAPDDPEVKDAAMSGIICLFHDLKIWKKKIRNAVEEGQKELRACRGRRGGAYL